MEQELRVLAVTEVLNTLPDEAQKKVGLAVKVIESVTGIPAGDSGEEWEHILSEQGFEFGHLPRNIWSAQLHLDDRNGS